jgi:hypothetical protein
MVDPIQLLLATPYAWVVPYVLAAAGCCAVITAAVPAPKSGPLASVWALLNFIGANWGHAKNVAASPSDAPPGNGQAASVLALALAGLTLSACAVPAQLQTVEQKAVVAGQLSCAQATAAGPLVVALADAAGAPVVVTGAASATVAAACAAIGAIPVTPPANPATAPVVAAPVVVTPSKSAS